VAGCGPNDLGSAGSRIFYFITMSRDDMKPIQPPVEWVPEVLSPELKWLEHEGDHSAVTSIKIKNVCHYVSLSPFTHICLDGMVLD
jgi:hypothetical protein